MAKNASKIRKGNAISTEGKRFVRDEGRSIKQFVPPSERSTEGDCPVWMFDRLDMNGKFAFDPKRPDFDHKDFLEKMIAYSNMTWGQIRSQTHDAGKSKHHMLSADSLSKEALERIVALHLGEETDRIFSFALGNRLRIVGIRDRREFHVLWYDSEHGVCPSRRR